MRRCAWSIGACAAFALAWTLACGGGSDAAPEAVPAAAPETVPEPWALDDAWSLFFEDRFGAPATVAVRVDVLGDGNPDLLARVGGTWMLFGDLDTVPPNDWSVLDGVDGDEVTALDRAAAVAAAPEIAELLGATAGAVGFGQPATVLVFWHTSLGEPAWVPLFPEEVSAEVAAARARVPTAFAVTENNLLGEAGFEGEAPLDQAFCGDFDGDGHLEVAVLADGQVLRWAGGEPTAHPVAYLGDGRRKAALRRGPSTLHPYSDDGEPEPIALAGDALDIWAPEASSIVLYLDGEGWHEVFTGD